MVPAARSLLLASIVAASAAHAQTSAALPGWTITTNMTVDSGDANRRTSMAMRQQVTARNLRWEFVQVSGYATPVSIEGMYTIIDVADSTITSVMPAQHMATVMGLGFLSDTKMPIVSSEEHLTRSDLQDLGDGGRILGHATRHYRLTTAGSMTVGVGGETCDSRLDSVTDMWIAADVDLGPAAEAVVGMFGSMSGLGSAPAQRGATKATMPKGTALRSVSTRTAPDATGRDITITMTTEVVEFAHKDLDRSVFSVPDDIQKMDMRKMMADLPAGMLDSAMKAGASEGATAATKALCHSGGAR